MPEHTSIRIATSVACGILTIGTCAVTVTAVGGGAAAAAEPAVVSSRPDPVSAMSTARDQDKRVEDLSKRTPSTATFANPSGTWTTEAYSGLVRSKDDQDKWVDIDPSIDSAGKGYEPTAVPFDVVFSEGQDTKLATVSTDEGAALSLGWPEKLPTAEPQGDTVTFPGAAAGDDLVVTSRRDGFNFSVELDQAPAADAAPLVYRVPLHLGEGRLVAHDDGSFEVKKNGTTVAAMTVPVMWDAAKDAERTPVAADIEGTGDDRVLVLRPDMDYLRDAKRTFPVTVDPTVVLTATGDTWVQSFLDTASKDTHPELQVGTTSLGLNVARSYAAFDISGISAGAGVTSATLSLSNFDTGSCSGSAIRISRVTSTLALHDMTWGTQPTTTASGAATSTQSYGSNCGTEGTVSFDATAIVQAWADGSSNNGIQIKADSETDASGWRRYRSLENGTTSKVPKLSITYNSRPATPTGFTAAPGLNNYVTTKTPTLSAVVSDPDAGQVRGSFKVKSGSTVVWSGPSSWVTSGGRAEVSIPSGTLTEGTTYDIEVSAQDASLTSTSSATRTMTVDTTPPTATITVSGFTNNGWTTTPPASSTVTVNGVADTAGFYFVNDGVRFPAFAADANGDIINSAAQTPGWHVFEATPVDKAGNMGTPTTFSFGAGSAAAFATPNPWSESVSSFPVQLMAPPSATSATLSWQLFGETSWRSTTAVTAGASSWSGSVDAGGGHSETPLLNWKPTAEAFGTGTLEAPAIVVLRGCFHYASGPDVCSQSWPLILTDSARGGNRPVASLGPASVALLSGEATIGDVDAADSQVGVGRMFESFSDATLTAGVFGPGWSDPQIFAGGATGGEVMDNRAKDGSFMISTVNGSQAFVPKAGSTTEFVPLEPTGDDTLLTFTPGSNGSADRLSLSQPIGSQPIVTTWTLKPSDTGGDPEWTLDVVDPPGDAGVTVQTATASQRPVWIQLSTPGDSGTCTATVQTEGCRGLKVAYTGSGSSTRVASLARVTGAPSQSNVVSRTLATYSYDGAGKLSGVCSVPPAAGQAPLCVTYSYTVVSGRTLISQVTPPGQAPWRIQYDSSGRLATVKREKPTGGDAEWSIDYSLTPSSSGLPNMSASATAEWGQEQPPTKVIAVYPPFTGTASVSKAKLYYTATDGTTTNTAAYGSNGWLVDSSWYDDHGNAVQNLDPIGWSRTQSAPQAQRLTVAAEESSYSVYNTWGDSNVQGTRVVDQYGPARAATRPNGITGRFRTHTHTTYDDDPTVDPALIVNRPGSEGLGLVVKEVVSSSDVARGQDFEPRPTKYSYDPIVAGDGNGWVLGTPSKVSRQLGTGWSESITRSDSRFRVVEERRPGGTADSSGAGADPRSTTTTYYSASGTGDCGGKPAWVDLVCKVAPASQAGVVPVPTTYYSSYDVSRRPTAIQELSNGVVIRTRTATYDDLGRVSSTTTSTTGSGVNNEAVTTDFKFDPATGLPTETTSSGKTVTTTYDTWGRVSGYSDALGTSTATGYDGAGNVATRTVDGTESSYHYDEHGLLNTISVSGVGTFGFSTNSDGTTTSTTYPNGVVATHVSGLSGGQTKLTYSQGATKLLEFTSTATVSGLTLTSTSAQSGQKFAYDELDHLSTVEDARLSGCTTRTYEFDSSSNRSTLSQFGTTATGACQSSTVSQQRSTTHDAAGRDTNTGYSYDLLGRALTIPQDDAGPRSASNLTATYHAEDKVATLTQTVSGSASPTQMQYGLDPAGRFGAITTTVGGTPTGYTRYRYADSTDSPASVEQSPDGTSWMNTKYVIIPGIGMAASSTGSTSTIQLCNLRGDNVATISGVTGSSSLSSYAESDEYGIPVDPAIDPGRYSFLGAHQRSFDTPGRGTALMGARLYIPATGEFSSADPVNGGNVTPYTYPQNPIDQFDTSGLHSSPGTGLDGGALCRDDQFIKPFLDTHGWVGVPKSYCYNPKQDGDWHDYCSKSADGYGDVSFRGPCAYHDMCLQHGWGSRRSDCDGMFLSYAHRNCNYYYARHSGGWLHNLGGCGDRVDAMWSVLRVNTARGAHYESGPWPCFVRGNYKGEVYIRCL